MKILWTIRSILGFRCLGDWCGNHEHSQSAWDATLWLYSTCVQSNECLSYPANLELNDTAESAWCRVFAKHLWTLQCGFKCCLSYYV